MPCSDGRDRGYDRETEEQRRFAESALCAVLTYCESNNIDILPNIDYKEAGITRTLLTTWWRKHKEIDRLRREREKVLKEQEQLKQTAISKLTFAERMALGLK